MNKPRIFLGSSGKQAKLLQAITRGLEDVADVEPWTTIIQPGQVHPRPPRRALPGGRFRRVRVRPGRLDARSDASQPGQASPRDNVVFEAGLFGGALARRAVSSSTRTAPNCRATCSG